MATGKISTSEKKNYPRDEKINKLSQPINVCKTFLFGVSAATRTVFTAVFNMNS
jgi:hypothetical protein